MNCNPLDAALMHNLQGLNLGIKSHFLYGFYLTLLSLCKKFPMLGNGRLTLNAALPNISIATILFLSQVHHFHFLLQVDQVATLQQHFRALLPMCNLLRLL
jgi:hypothetical protein